MGAAEFRRDTLIELRLRAGLTQQDLAYRVRVRSQTVSAWETKPRVPRLKPSQFVALKRELGCTDEELVAAMEGNKKSVVEG